MGGQDKGLLHWHGEALARHVAHGLAPQVRQLTLNANRHAEQYGAWGWPVLRDDPDLPSLAGPLCGMLTGLRHAGTPWLQFSPCDSPALPTDLVRRLHDAACSARALIAVPVSTDPATHEPRHHWTTALAHRDTLVTLEALLAQGERRVRQWVGACAWIGVCFERPADFININTPETLHGTPWP